MNLTSRVRRAIVVAALASTIAGAVGAAGAAQADDSVPSEPPPVEVPPAPPTEESPPAEDSPTSNPTPPAPPEPTVAPTTTNPPTAPEPIPPTTEPPVATEPPPAPPKTTQPQNAIATTTTTPNAVPVTVAAMAATAPQSLAATPGNTSVKLTWKAPASNGGATIDKYAVQRYTAEGWKAIAYPTTLGYSATGLTNGTKYSFRILAHNAVGWSAPSTVVAAVPRTVPTAPRSPVATAGNASVKLTWLAPASNGGATVQKYAVQRYSNGTWINVAFPTGPTYTVTQLANGTKYSFRIRAYNAAGWSPVSTTVNGVPHSVAPSVPQSLVAVPGNQAVSLNWKAPSSNGGATVDKYRVQRYNTTSKVWTSIDTWPVLFFTDNGLTNGTKYSFRVAAHNAVGWGPYSTVVNAIPRTVPGAIGLTAYSGIESGSVNLYWTVNNDGGSIVDGYQLDLATSAGGPWDPIAWPGPGTTSYKAPGLSPGSTYYFRVFAHNAAGWSTPSAVVNYTVPPTVPSKPAACSAYQVNGPGSHTAQIKWSPPTNNGGTPITGYNVAISDYGNHIVFSKYVSGFVTGFGVNLDDLGYYYLVVIPDNKVGVGPSCTFGPLVML